MGKMRRLGRGDHTKLQEDMAWQMAEMFIKDVTRYLDLEELHGNLDCDIVYKGYKVNLRDITL